jgi:uncharacterized protein (TIGR03083 family)
VGSELVHIQTRLAVEGEKTATFFESLSKPDWDQPVYTTGSRWQVKQVLAHFISAERAYQKYIQDLLQGGTGPPGDLDIDAFNEAEAPALSTAPAADLIRDFRRVRTDTLRLTRALEEADLKRIGNHPWFGEKDLGWYLKLLYRHNTMHLQDVRKALETGGALPPTDLHRTGRKINPSTTANSDQ